MDFKTRKKYHNNGLICLSPQKTLLLKIEEWNSFALLNIFCKYLNIEDYKFTTEEGTKRYLYATKFLVDCRERREIIPRLKAQAMLVNYELHTLRIYENQT